MPLWDYGERARAVSSNSFVKARFAFAVCQAKPPSVGDEGRRTTGETHDEGRKMTGTLPRRPFHRLVGLVSGCRREVSVNSN